LLSELDVVEIGLRGIVASAKMSTFFDDCFSDALEYGDDVCDVDEGNDVSRGESSSIWRLARGELGMPLGESCG
jgi:hypothetical protein